MSGAAVGYRQIEIVARLRDGTFQAERFTWDGDVGSGVLSAMIAAILDEHSQKRHGYVVVSASGVVEKKESLI